MQNTTVGLDIAKHTFHLVVLDRHQRVVRRKKLSRHKLLAYFAQHPACTVALEACATSHYWGRALQRQGHTVRLLPARAVKPYVRGNKNDYNDALAIAEACFRPGLRTVPIKSVEDQDRQALHRLREGVQRQRQRLANQLRALLAEYGLIAPQGLARLRRMLAEQLEAADNGLSDTFRALLYEGYSQLQELDAHLQAYDRRIQVQTRASEAAQRLQSIPGFGPLASSAYLNLVGDGRAYRCGRDVSAALGLVPRQHSSGDKQVLLGISKRGNRYVRTLLVHGARSVVRVAHRKTDALSRWVLQLIQRCGRNKAIVALANKLARIAWAILRQGGVYQPRLADTI